MIKDLALAITDTPGDANALETALALADHAGAHLTVIKTVYMPVIGAWGTALDAVATQKIEAEVRAMAEVKADRIRERLGRESVPSEVRMVELLSDGTQRAAALHARYADMTVMSSAEDSAYEGSIVHAFFSAMLLETGRPVLLVPPHYQPAVPPRHVVVAWQPTREASRALHDALPLLHAAATVDVLEIESGRDGDDEGRSAAEIVAHLARHGLEARVVVQRKRGSVASTLLRHCEQSGAELLVAGGYGHSRLREWTLGGTTHDLVRAAQLPVLFSH